MLPFDTVAGQQPEWDHRLDLTPGVRVVQVFTATEDDLSRIEVFLVHPGGEFFPSTDPHYARQNRDYQEIRDLIGRLVRSKA